MVDISQHLNNLNKMLQSFIKVDISQHLNNLNKMLQSFKRLVTQYYDTIGCI